MHLAIPLHDIVLVQCVMLSCGTVAIFGNRYIILIYYYSNIILAGWLAGPTCLQHDEKQAGIVKVQKKVALLWTLTNTC